MCLTPILKTVGAAQTLPVRRALSASKLAVLNFREANFTFIRHKPSNCRTRTKRGKEQIVKKGTPVTSRVMDLLEPVLPLAETAGLNFSMKNDEFPAAAENTK